MWLLLPGFGQRGYNICELEFKYQSICLLVIFMIHASNWLRMAENVPAPYERKRVRFAWTGATGESLEIKTILIGR